ncbi:MAG: TetR/AcrR family transcriptional regulator [Candidatus Hermodarchaeia archaeon]
MTEDHKRANYERILQASAKLFAERGYHGTSMNDIVEKSGLSKGAIYGHFESKEQLFLTLQERQLAIDLNQIKRVFSPEDSATEKLKKSVDIVFTSMCECPKDACRIMLEFYVVASRMKSLQPRLNEYYSDVNEFIAEIIRDGVRNGEFKSDIDVDAVSTICMSVLNGLQFYRATASTVFDLDKTKAELIALILEGIKDGKQ